MFEGGGPTIAGALHVLCSDAHGFQTYIKAYRCNDKQGEIARLTHEVERLKRGDFTPEEFQNLCHDLHERPDCTFAIFAEGCEDMQRKLFGRGAVAEERAACARLAVQSACGSNCYVPQIEAAIRAREDQSCPTATPPS